MWVQPEDVLLPAPVLLSLQGARLESRQPVVVAQAMSVHVDVNVGAGVGVGAAAAAPEENGERKEEEEEEEDTFSIHNVSIAFYTFQLEGNRRNWFPQ